MFAELHDKSANGSATANVNGDPVSESNSVCANLRLFMPPLFNKSMNRYP